MMLRAQPITKQCFHQLKDNLVTCVNGTEILHYDAQTLELKSYEKLSQLPI